MTMRWLLWLCPPWSRKARRREWLIESAAQAEAEQRAAIVRMLSQSTEPFPNVRAAPLMTPSQRAQWNRRDW